MQHNICLGVKFVNIKNKQYSSSR